MGLFFRFGLLLLLLLALILPLGQAFRIPLDFDVGGPFLQSSLAGL